MRKQTLLIIGLLVLLPLAAQARIYVWVGGPEKKDLAWKNPSSWNPPNDSSYPSTTSDTAQFTSLAGSSCVLNANVEIAAVQCLPGFSKTLHLSNKRLSVSGDADFSNGTLIASKGYLVFTGARGSRQMFRPKEGAAFADILMSGAGTVTVTGAPLKAGAFTLSSGTWRFGKGVHTISDGLTIRDNADLEFASGVTLDITSGNADFSGLGSLKLESEDTLCFSAPSDTQIFIPRKDVLFPAIKKTNKGIVALTSSPLNAGPLIMVGGTWDWASGVRPDTVASIATSGGTMTLGSSTIVVKAGDADLSGLVNLRANTGVIDFAGSETQYYTPANSGMAGPKIKHSGTGLLFRGKRGGKAVLDKSGSERAVYFAPEKAAIRARVLSLELGMNLYGSEFISFSRQDTVSRTGVAFGIMLPIRVPKVLLWYHVRMLFHGTRSQKYGPMKYWSGVNEVIVGKPFLIKYLPFEYTPLAGIGLTEGIKLKNNLSEFYLVESHPFLFTSLGFLVRTRDPQNRKAPLRGVLITWERGFFGAIDSRMRMGLTGVYGF